MTFFARYHLNEGLRGLFVGAGILFVVVTLAFAPFAYGDRTLMSSAAEEPSLFSTGGTRERTVPFVTYRGFDPAAAAWQTEPMFLLEHQEVVHERSLPLWNPYVGYGEPLAADLLSQPYFPLTWLPIADPSARAYNWFIILRFYVAALFAFLYLRFFVRFTAALAGGIAYAFTGYLILFFNIAHLSVECMIPGLFFAIELLVRKPSARSTVALACTVAIVIFGGMPESALLAFAFAFPYALVRILSDESARRSRKMLFARLSAATALGIGMSACLLLPAYEFLKLSLNQHEASMIGGAVDGLAADPFSFSILPTYLAPLIYGLPWSSIFGPSYWTGIRGFFGVAQTYFALIAIVGIVTEVWRRSPRAWSPGPYVLAVAVLVFLKRFGNPLVNWVGALPGFSLIAFPKYEEPILGFCIACLAALGIERLAAGKVNARIVWIAALLPLTLLATVPKYEAVVVGLTWFATTARGRQWLPQLAPLGIILIAGEGVASYIGPIWYVVVEESPLSSDPANGASYVDFLRSRTAVDRSRFYGEDALLSPEWSSAFGISDVQDLNALYDHRYMKFVRAFIPPGPGLETVDRFTGALPIEFDRLLERRFLALSSIAYLGTERTLGGAPSLLAVALAARPKDTGPALRAGWWTIAGSRRDAVFMHAPQFRYVVPAVVPKTATILPYAIAMDPGVWTTQAGMCGDGVNFTIELRDRRGAITTLARKYIDPKNDAGERRWFDFSTPVARWAGQRVEMLFSTKPGPSGLNCADWALWSGIGFDTPPPLSARSPFHLVYDTEDANIYHFDGALPRLALYSGVVVAADDQAALHLLSDPKFDPYARAVITDDGQAARAAAADLGTAPAPVAAGQIDVYTSQHVHAWVDAGAPSLAVLNDIVFPGWTVSLDGHDVPVITANYMFRGVLVPKGHHSLDFSYRPSSFRIGLAISVLSILAAVLYIGRSFVMREGSRQ